MLAKDDRVLVLNVNGRGEIVEEGIATIRKVLGADRYEVEFDEERGARYVRFVEEKQKIS